MFRKKRLWLLVLPFVGLLLWLANRRPPESISPLTADHVLYKVMFDGDEHVLTDEGIVYRVLRDSGNWTYVDQVFDPKEVERSYRESDGVMHRVSQDDGRLFPVFDRFEEGFEELPTDEAGLRELISESRLWTEVTLQSKATPEVPDYVKLRNAILRDNQSFIDARVAPSSEQAHSGKHSLHCLCPPCPGSMICTKASLGTGLPYYVQGDDLWFQGWFFVDGDTLPLTLVDMECDLVKVSPGIRLMLHENRYLGAELKALEKPKYQQPAETRVAFPTRQWVEVTWHVKLHPGNEGVIQIWQDGQLILDTVGTTLPFPTAIVNKMEIGVSAHNDSRRPASLYVDDVMLSHQELVPAPR